MPSANLTIPSPTYQHVVVRGLPYDRGLSHGQQVAAKIRTNVNYYRQPGKLASPALMQRMIETVYIPALRQYYPSGFNEMRGIADGAGVSLEDVVLLNARYDLARVEEKATSETSGNGINSRGTEDNPDECTSAFFLSGATASGDVLNCQNWDMSARLWSDDCVIYLEVHPDPSEHKPSLFLVSEAGQLGRSGMNSYGLAVTVNSLMSTDDCVPDVSRPCLPLSVLRRMLLESSHLAEAMTAAFNFPRHVSNNLTVASSQGFGMSLEVTPDRVYKVYRGADDPYLVHTNHFVHEGFQARTDIRDRYPGGSSWFRRDRFDLGVRAAAKAGVVTPETLIAAFSDHISYPEGLCNHPADASAPGNDNIIRDLPGYPFRGTSATVACVIYNATQRTVTVCKGPPCQGTFQTFALGGPLAPSAEAQLGGRVAAVKVQSGPERP